MYELSDKKNREIFEAFENTEKKESGKKRMDESVSQADFVDELGMFYVVTIPVLFRDNTVIDELGDILREVDLNSVYYQFKGGLDIDEIAFVTNRKNEAQDVAEELLAEAMGMENPQEPEEVYIKSLKKKLVIPYIRS